MGLQAPINFVTTPGVSLSAACFGNLRYEDDNSGDCLSNLLAIGFRRVEIDLFWDQGRHVWSFCPVAISVSIANAGPIAIESVFMGISARSPLASDAASSSPLSILSQSTSSSSSSSKGNFDRQVTSISSSSSGTPTIQTDSSSSTTGTTLGQSLPSISIIPNSPNAPLVSVGPYTCSSTIDLSTFLSQFLDYIQKTDNDVGASLLYVIINVHASANDSFPLEAAPAPSTLPQRRNLLSTLFSEYLSEYLYTPSDLASNRANINGSWYTVPEEFRPIDAFYSTHVNENNIASTEDGWPTEGYIELLNSKRLLLGFGSVAPQMSGYNFSGDHSTIFPSGYLQNSQLNVNATSSGHVTQGCYLRKNTDNLSGANSSWATSSTISGFDYPTSPSSDLSPLLNLTSNLTSCGISPFLNVTLLNSTANENFTPYEQYSYATIWSWAPGEPKNQSSNEDVPNSLFRCAFSKIDLGGRWVVNDCSTKSYASCRAHRQPYNWTITTYPIAYSFAEEACPDGYTFAVPRTALENSYLYQAVKAAERDYDQNGVWIDFNSLKTQACWVSGRNTDCPYLQPVGLQGARYKKYVVVSFSG